MIVRSLSGWPLGPELERGTGFPTWPPSLSWTLPCPPLWPPHVNFHKAIAKTKVSLRLSLSQKPSTAPCSLQKKNSKFLGLASGLSFLIRMKIFIVSIAFLFVKEIVIGCPRRARQGAGVALQRTTWSDLVTHTGAWEGQNGSRIITRGTRDGGVKRSPRKGRNVVLRRPGTEAAGPDGVPAGGADSAGTAPSGAPGAGSSTSTGPERGQGGGCGARTPAGQQKAR